MISSSQDRAGGPITRGALKGVRVIDLSQVLAGPFCTQLLADQGADVVKVEPLRGDETRHLGPYRADDELRSYGGYYQSVNRNKRSIAIDLKAPEGKEMIFRLVETADVLVENYRQGVMERLGLSYEALSERNPKLVYAAIRGFGDPRTGSSPYVGWPAFDVVAQAMGGMMGITGQDGVPLKIGPGVGDLIPATMAAFGIVSALLEARSSGKGQFVDVGMVDSVLAICERIVHQHSFIGAVPKPEGNRHPLLCPFGLVQASDGWIAIGAPHDELWRRLAKIIGHPELGSDPRFATNAARLEIKSEVYELIESFTSVRSKDELKMLLGGQVPFSPVMDVTEIFADEHFRAREMLVDVEQPGSATPVTIAGVPIKMSRTPGGVHRRAPLLGEHTDELLGAIGYGAGEIEALRRQSIIS
jgi:crotonobetainyl-CoA:carnitine CoA-transferase CaiB-like acyl-CoA transferase